MKINFKPRFLVRSGFIQTFMASQKFSVPGNAMIDAAQKIILTGGNNEKLLAFHSKQKGKSKGTVLLIHGWEGSSNSTYVIKTGGYLFDCGFDVIRINQRDHGESHHLNKGLFNCTLLDEVFGAMQSAAKLSPKQPFFIAGFSIGGNFALRLAIKNGKRGIPNLKHVVAISPVINARHSTEAVDSSFIIRKYFLTKWRASLLKKQAVFPKLYDFGDIQKFTTIMSLTDELVRRYMEFKSCEAYLDKYSITSEQLKKIKIPTTLISSADDPVIPVSDVQDLEGSEYFEKIILPYGGHNGFFDILPYSVWYHSKMLECFSAAE